MNRFIAAALVAALGSVPVAAAAAQPAKCAIDHQPARIAQVVTPELPPIAKVENLSGSALVQVDISQSGRVVGAKVLKSSGSAILDRAAIDAVTNSAYKPEVAKCEAVPGSYIVGVEFPNS